MPFLGDVVVCMCCIHHAAITVAVGSDPTDTVPFPFLAVT